MKQTIHGFAVNGHHTVSKALLFAAIVVAGSGCGGGGGGGGGGRTTETAVRLIHSGIDVAPLDVEIAGMTVQQAPFAGLTEFVPVPPGPVTINLNRANTPGASFRALSQTLLKDTEYSIFVAGSLLREEISVLLLEEPVTRPAEGRGRVQLLNGLEGSSGLTLEGTGAAESVVAPFGRSSGFVDVPVGPLTLTAVNGRGGPVGTFTVTMPEQGELTLVVEGSLPIGAVFTRVFSDLD